jgi:hypothetical protein
MTSLKEFDMHGLKYLDAQFEACRRMEEAYSEGLLGVRFIHGYKHGNDLQSYVRKAQRPGQGSAPALPRDAVNYREARRAGSYVGAVRGREGLKSQSIDTLHPVATSKSLISD